MDKAQGSAQDKAAWHAAHGQAWEDQLERSRLEKARGQRGTAQAGVGRR